VNFFRFHGAFSLGLFVLSVGPLSFFALALVGALCLLQCGEGVTLFFGDSSALVDQSLTLLFLLLHVLCNGLSDVV